MVFQTGHKVLIDLIVQTIQDKVIQVIVTIDL